MASSTLIVNYRPLRIGFCVPANSVPDVLRAVELNTILWGGIHNPIIPIGANIDAATRLVKLFQPDLLLAVTESEPIKEFIASYPNLEWTNHFEGKLFYHQERGKTPSILDISHIIDHYWKTEFKNVKKSNCILPQWKNDDPLASAFTIEFGKFPVDSDLIYKYEKAYKNGLRAKPEKINKTDVVPQVFDARMFPIHITKDRLKVWGGGSGGWGKPGVYLGDLSNPLDLTNFWNLRASAIDIKFLPRTGSARLKLFIKKHLDEIRKAEQTEAPEGVAIWYRDTLSEAAVARATKSYFAEGEIRTHCRVSDYLWDGSIKNTQVFFESKTILASVDFPFNKPTIAIQLPEKPIVGQNRYTSRQQIGFSFHPLTEYEYKGHTLKLPFLSDLNEWYARQITFSPYGFRIGRDKSTIIQELHDETLNLRPIKDSEIIKKIFLYAGIAAVDSQPGLIAKRLIDQMGEVDDCRVFKVTGVRKLISNLDPTQPITFSNAIQNIRDSNPATGIPSFDRFKSLYIQQREALDLTPQEVWDYLIDKNTFRAGLEPLCPNCNLSFWLPIKDAADSVKCEYCGKDFKLGKQLRHRGDFRFRRSGLFGRNDNQEGAIPVVLTLMTMERLDRIDKSIFTTALKLNSRSLGIDCETDFALLDSNNGEKPAMAIGECKTSGEITQQDIDNLLKVKEALDSKGIDAFLLFSKTVAFTPDEITRFKDLVTKGVYPILFTDVELEPYEPYTAYRNATGINLPEPYTHTYEGVATNSHHIYLR